MVSRKVKQWRLAQVEAAKASVRAELTQIEQTKGAAERLKAGLEQAFQLMNELDSESQLKCFVTVVSTLYYHARHGGLSRSQINRLAQLGVSLLQLQGIKPQQSKLSFLFGELKLVLSQISRGEGRQWLSAWQLALAQYLSGGSKGPLSEGAYELALATGLSRLGHMDLALAGLSRALFHGLQGREYETARLRQLRCLRLVGRFEDAASLVSQLQTERLSATCNRDIAWEKACLETMQTGDFTPIGKLILRGKPHYLATYLVEGWLWAASLASLEPLGRCTKMISLSRNKRLAPRQLGAFFDIALQLEKFTDSEIPYGFRLIDVGSQLEQLDATMTIDKTLLVWAALSRLLARNGSYDFATLALARYRDLSRQLSDGASDDVLRVLGDLFEKSWFRDKQMDLSQVSFDRAI